MQIFLEYALLFLDALLFLEIKIKQKKEKKADNFLEGKVQPQGVTQLLLHFFCQFQSDVAYKKSVYSISKMLENTLLVNFSNY